MYSWHSIATQQHESQCSMSDMLMLKRSPDKELNGLNTSTVLRTSCAASMDPLYMPFASRKQIDERVKWVVLERIVCTVRHIMVRARLASWDARIVPEASEAFCSHISRSSAG